MSFPVICKNHPNIKTELGIYCSVCKDNWFRERARQTLGDMSRGGEVEQLFYLQAGICSYSGDKLEIGVNASLDHKIPRSKGGSNDITNLQWVLTSVNLMKSAMDHDEFIALIQRIAKRHTFTI